MILYCITFFCFVLFYFILYLICHISFSFIFFYFLFFPFLSFPFISFYFISFRFVLLFFVLFYSLFYLMYRQAVWLVLKAFLIALECRSGTYTSTIQFLKSEIHTVEIKLSGLKCEFKSWFWNSIFFSRMFFYSLSLAFAFH